jgi:hypothetical protein
MIKVNYIPRRLLQWHIGLALFGADPSLFHLELCQGRGLNARYTVGPVTRLDPLTCLSYKPNGLSNIIL